MATGTVKWFNNAKGYGFILPEDGGHDLFVHYSSIEMDGYRTLKAGQAVEYETHEGDKGCHATAVTAPGGASIQREPRRAPDRELTAPGQAPGFGVPPASDHAPMIGHRATAGSHADGVATAMMSAIHDD